MANPTLQSLQEALAHHRAGRLDRAESLYRRVLALAPKQAQAAELLGQLLLQKGRTAEAIPWLQTVCGQMPRAAGPALRLATALAAAGRAGDAEALLRRVVATEAGNAEAWRQLGYVLNVRGRIAGSLEAYERALQLQPEDAKTWHRYGMALAFSGRNFRALECQDRALALDPGLAAARFGRAQALHKIYRLPEAVAEYDAYLAAEPGNLEARSYRLFACQNLAEMSRARLAAEHREYGRRAGGPAGPLPPYDCDPERKLRLAIWSPDLRVHSCAYFLEPLLAGLNPDEFELHLYHDHFVEDAQTARFRALAAGWRNLVGRPNAEAERIVRADRPDVVVDLAGHTGITVRLPVFAHRVAPVQITYLGYPDSTGVGAMDYRFTDAIADPVGGADVDATEKLVRFAPTAWAYRPPGDAPVPVPPPGAEPGRPVTFGCFSSPTKFTAPLLAAWARILARVPESRLLLKGRDFDEPRVREDILQRLAAAGVPAARVEILARTADTRSHLELYGRVDIALDTFPYTGTTTTCEALWMGRPVVTQCGDRHAARVGASLLTAVGRPGWIAHSTDNYVEIAAALARDPAGLVQAVAELRPAMQASALLDHAAQSRRFAEAIRACWRERVAVDAPAEAAVA